MRGKPLCAVWHGSASNPLIIVISVIAGLAPLQQYAPMGRRSSSISKIQRLDIRLCAVTDVILNRKDHSRELALLVDGLAIFERIQPVALLTN